MSNSKNGVAATPIKSGIVKPISQNLEKSEILAQTVEAQKERKLKLVSLFERHEKLCESKKTLKQFDLSAVNHRRALTLEDGKGANFSTNNPVVISKIIALILEEVEIAISSTESEIKIV